MASLTVGPSVVSPAYSSVKIVTNETLAEELVAFDVAWKLHPLRWEFPDGHGVIVLAEGRLLNLGCATGHPSFVMSNSFTNQVIAQISLYDKKIAGTDYQPGKIYVLPKHLDEEVARLHLKSLGAELTELSEAQAKYSDIPQAGPFKKDEYRY